MAAAKTHRCLLSVLLVVTMSPSLVESGTKNHVYTPCGDTHVQRSDGFTFAIAFASRSAFFYNNNSSLQLSPCDTRLSFSSQNAQISVFRPKVDEISLLTINTSNFSPDNYGGYMVAFAGRKYAANAETGSHNLSHQYIIWKTIEFEESTDPEQHFQALLLLAKEGIKKGKNKDKFSAGVTHSFTGSAEDRDKLLFFNNMYIV